MTQSATRKLVSVGWKISLKWSDDDGSHSVSTIRSMPASANVADVLRIVGEFHRVDLAKCDHAEATTTGYRSWCIEDPGVPVGTTGVDGVEIQPSGKIAGAAHGALA
jgi:hypothetical protein